jgi:nitrile hydratase
MKRISLRAVHDVGGLPSGPVPRDEHAEEEWALRKNGLRQLVIRSGRGITLDELRRHVEQLGHGSYEALEYSERAMHAVAMALIEHGVITIEELAAFVASAPHPGSASAAAMPPKAAPSASSVPSPVTPLFQAGDQVRVKHVIVPGHVRTPLYCRGKVGTVERFCGTFANPEELAYGRPGLPKVPLYRVRFLSRGLWEDYREKQDDVVEIEIFQHWLEPHR